MENVVINIYYVFASLFLIGVSILIIYGLIHLISIIIEDYRDGDFWFSPKK